MSSNIILITYVFESFLTLVTKAVSFICNNSSPSVWYINLGYELNHSIDRNNGTCRHHTLVHNLYVNSHNSELFR